MKRFILLGLLIGSTLCQAQPKGNPGVHRLCCDREIPMGTRLTSPNGRYFLIFQTDKNVVLYKKTREGDKPLWHTNTANHTTKTVMQSDGNFVLYENGRPIWASNTNGNLNAALVLQDDGNLVIYSADKRFLWATNTAQPAEPEAFNQLCCDREVAMGDRITSPNGRFFLIFQTDRNVVLYKKTTEGDKPLWHTNTANHTTRMVMQADGNFVLYENSAPIWASNTNGNPNASLVMQDDGNLVIYAADKRFLWATNTAQPAEPVATNILCCDKEIAMGNRITSPNGRFFLIFQTDRNVVLYKKSREGDKPLWHTNTANHTTRVVMQADGNFVMYENAAPVWTSNTYGNPNASLVMQDDGNLVIYAADKRFLWASNTAQPAEPEATNQICCDNEVSMGNRITSTNGRYFLIFQTDRNVVLYKKTNEGDKPLWHTNTANHTTRTVMQSDGNFVAYENATPVWTSNTYGNPNASLVLQDDGNLAIYSTDNRMLWATNTVQAADQVVVPVVLPAKEEPQTVAVAAPCGMTEHQYNAAVQAIKGQAFRDPKMEMAKRSIKNKCLNLNQIRGIAKLFSFEDQTIDFVIYAYEFTDAKDEYYTLENLFKFSSNKEKLNEFLSGK